MKPTCMLVSVVAFSLAATSARAEPARTSLVPAPATAVANADTTNDGMQVTSSAALSKRADDLDSSGRHWKIAGGVLLAGAALTTLTAIVAFSAPCAPDNDCQIGNHALGTISLAMAIPLTIAGLPALAHGIGLEHDADHLRSLTVAPVISRDTTGVALGFRF